MTPLLHLCMDAYNFNHMLCVASASVSSSSRGDSWVKLRARIALTDLDRAGVVAPLGVDVGPDAKQVRHGADHLTVVLRICFPLRALLTLWSIHKFASPLIMQNLYESLISARNVLKPLIIFVTATRLLRPTLYRTAENKSNYFRHVSIWAWDWLLSASLTPLKIKFTQNHIFYRWDPTSFLHSLQSLSWGWWAPPASSWSCSWENSAQIQDLSLSPQEEPGGI